MHILYVLMMMALSHCSLILPRWCQDSRPKQPVHSTCKTTSRWESITYKALRKEISDTLSLDLPGCHARDNAIDYQPTMPNEDQDQETTAPSLPTSPQPMPTQPLSEPMPQPVPQQPMPTTPPIPTPIPKPPEQIAPAPTPLAAQPTNVAPPSAIIPVRP